MTTVETVRVTEELEQEDIGVTERSARCSCGAYLGPFALFREGGIPSRVVSSREDLLFEKIAIFEGDSDNRVIREALTDTHLPFEDEGEVQDILEEFRDKGLIK